MDETQLQIVVSVINNAADQLSEVGGQLSALGEQATEVGDQISSSLTASEEAFADSAMAAASQWEEATDEIGGAVTEAAENAQEQFQGMSEAARTAFNSTIQSAQEMEAELQQMMASDDSEIIAAATTVGEEAGTAAGEGFGGYFQKMIIGYALEQIGSFLSGGIESAIAAASKSGDQIATLSAQIEQQKAAIDVNEAALQKWYGTTAEVSAAHQKAAADIDAEKAKITDLTQQLASLTQAQEGLPGQIQDIADALLGWIAAHKQIEGELETFMTTLGPLLKGLGAIQIAITLISLALSVIDPVIAIFMLLAVVIAAGTAIWQTYHTQIMSFLNDLNAKTGIITFLQQAWDQVAQEFEDKLLPSLQKLWDALQPLTPLLKALAEVVGVTLLGALVLIVDGLTLGVTWFVNLLTAATNLATFFTNVLVVAINKVEDALNAVFNSAAFKAVSGLVGGTVSGISSVVSAVSGAAGSILKVNDAIITPGGGVIQTDVADYLIATKNPGALVGAASGASGGVTVNIYGGSYLDQNGATMIANALARQIQMQIKLKNFV